MNRNLDWPWSWEEEIEWKADLEERDYEFLQELIDNALGDTTADILSALGAMPEERFQDAGAEK